MIFFYRFLTIFFYPFFILIIYLRTFFKKEDKLRLILEKKSSALGFINGYLRLVRSKFEDDFSHYLFFWGKDELTRLDGYPPFAQIEVKKFKDGLTEKEIQVSTISQMDQEIEVKTEGKARPELSYDFPENTILPKDALTSFTESAKQLTHFKISLNFTSVLLIAVIHPLEFV